MHQSILNPSVGGQSVPGAFDYISFPMGSG